MVTLFAFGWDNREPDAVCFAPGSQLARVGFPDLLSPRLNLIAVSELCAKKRGQHCQDCHMKPTGKMTNMAPGHGGVERDPMTLANHRFFDGSREDMLRRCLQLSQAERLSASRCHLPPPEHPPRS